jgi:hypothetical protein
MDGEFLAVYLANDGARVVIPLVRDRDRAYRLSTTEGLQPVRHWLNNGDLEFQEYRPADPHSNAGQFMNQILSTPARKPRPALKREENAA